jgi:acid phosphatase
MLASAAFADNDDLPHYNKIVLVIEENQQYSTIIGNTSAPYTNWLAQHGALMTQSYGTEHPSQPNYLDLFSGGDQNISDDNHPGASTLPFTGENLAAQLLHTGRSFAGFSEDLPSIGDSTDDFGASPGDPTGTHDYARKHNPWCNWQNDAFPASIVNTGSNYLPSTVNQPFTPFAAISASGKFDQLPDFSVVVPDQKHDDHGISGGASGNTLIGDGDTWLQNNLSAYAAWAAKHNSLLIVTWDEDDYSTTSNQIATIFYGAHVKTGQFPENDSITYVSTVNADTGPQGVPVYQPTVGINHWNVLRTIEALYHLQPVGQANEVKTITDIFTHDHDKW